MANEHIERMKVEHRELKEKINALGAFIYGDSGIFDLLDKAEQVRMSQQYGFMNSYLRILDSRLWVANGNKEHK